MRNGGKNEHRRVLEISCRIGFVHWMHPILYCLSGDWLLVCWYDSQGLSLNNSLEGPCSHPNRFSAEWIFPLLGTAGIERLSLHRGRENGENVWKGVGTYSTSVRCTVFDAPYILFSRSSSRLPTWITMFDSIRHFNTESSSCGHSYPSGRTVNKRDGIAFEIRWPGPAR